PSAAAGESGVDTKKTASFNMHSDIPCSFHPRIRTGKMNGEEKAEKVGNAPERAVLSAVLIA
ncbi:hypothetical protein KUCAC02_021980, partial [Chaenocephalus aceratus]